MEVCIMENNRNKNDAGKSIKETLITIFSVVLYITYSLIKGITETVRHPSGKGVAKLIKGIFLITSAVILIVLAITLWPLTLAIIVTGAIVIFGLSCLAP